MRWSDVMLRRRYHCLLAYKQSKLANVMFAVEFNRRVGPESGVRAYAADPGLVDTGIGIKGTGGLERWVWERRRNGGKSPRQGARTVVFLACSPSLRGFDAVYWKDCAPKPPSRYAMDPANTTRLWTMSERLCGITWG